MKGEAELQLVAGSPTCKCTAFELSHDKLAPGDEATLTVKWKGKFRDAGFSHGGPVRTNDPENTLVKFIVRGRVEEAFEMIPNDLWDAGEVVPNEATTFTARITSNLYEEFQINSISAESEFVSTEANPIEEEEFEGRDAISGYEVHVSISPDIPPGLFEDELTISLDKDDTELKIPLKGRKVGSVRILATPGVAYNPQTRGLTLGQFSAGEGRTAKLLLLVDQTDMTEPLEIESVEVDPLFVNVSLESAGETAGNIGRYHLLVSIPPGSPRTSRDASTPAQIRAKTNLPNGEIIDLRMRFRAF